MSLSSTLVAQPQSASMKISASLMGFNNRGLRSHAIQIQTDTPIEPSSKGLLNGPGQNNCFLNCAVQVSQLVTLYFLVATIAYIQRKQSVNLFIVFFC